MRVKVNAIIISQGKAMNRTQKLVQYLQERGDWVKASELASSFGVSDRQIRKYVASINNDVHLIISGPQGYRLDDSKFNEYVARLNAFSTEQENRQRYIIQKLVTSPGGIDIFDLADELYVSESSIKKDVHNLKSFLSKCHTSIKRNRNTITLDGNEENKRRLMYYLVQDYTFNTNIYDDNSKLFDLDYNYQEIKSGIISAFENHDIACNDYALGNITIHLGIILKRLKDGYQLEGTVQDESIIDTDVFKAAQDVAVWITRHFDVELSKTELVNMALIFKNNINQFKKLDYDTLGLHNLNKYVEQRYIDISKNLIQKVEQNYYLSPFKEEFQTKFTLHIQNLFYRAQNDFRVKNPLADVIRTTYPLIYDIAVFVAKELLTQYDIDLNEDEIAFISFHIGSYFENNAFIRLTRVNCAFIYTDYYDFYKITLDRIKKKFKDKISIVNVSSLNKFNNILSEDIDLLILPLGFQCDLNVSKITIKPFPDENDWDNLEKTIYNISQRKQKRELKDYILNFFSDELYLKEPDFKDGLDAVKKMNEHLLELGYVDDDFLDDVLSREELSTTAFNGIAVPHTLTTRSTYKSFIYIAIFQDGIQWTDEKYVNIIMMIGTNKNSRKLFLKFFDQLIKIFDTQANINKLLRTNDFNEFYIALDSLFSE